MDCRNNESVEISSFHENIPSILVEEDRSDSENSDIVINDKQVEDNMNILPISSLSFQDDFKLWNDADVKRFLKEIQDLSIHSQISEMVLRLRSIQEAFLYMQSHASFISSNRESDASSADTTRAKLDSLSGANAALQDLAKPICDYAYEIMNNRFYSSQFNGGEEFYIKLSQLADAVNFRFLRS